MDRRRLAADLADSVAEAQEAASRAIWSTLEPLIRSAWSAALRPRVSMTAAGIDDAALRRIASYSVPDDVGALITSLHIEGTLTAAAGFFDGPVPAGLFAEPVIGHAAVEYLGTATNRLVGVGEAAWSTAREVLTDTMGSTLGREEAKQALEQVLGVSEFRADVIARTEMGAAANKGVAYSAEVLKAAGFAVMKQWFASNLPGMRPEHGAADGQIVGVNDSFTVGGYELDMPGDPMGPPEMVIQCRCTMMIVEGDSVAVVDEES